MTKSAGAAQYASIEVLRERSIDEIHHKNIARSKMSNILPMLALMAGGFPSYGMRGRRCKPYDPLEGIDIQAEAELVRQKKSHLSYSQRQEVLRRAEKENNE